MIPNNHLMIVGCCLSGQKPKQTTMGTVVSCTQQQPTTATNGAVSSYLLLV